MKIQCQLCKEIVDIGPFRVEANGIAVTCQSCAGEFFVASAATIAAKVPAPRPAQPNRPSMTCPKCELEQADAVACSQCGLRADRFADFATTDDEQHAALSAMFAACQASWHDDDEHERFVAAVSEQSAFSYGAKRYRGILRERPGDAVAKKQLERFARMAEARLFTAAIARKSDEQTKEPYKAVVIMIIVFVVLLGIGGYYLLTLKGKRDDAIAPAVPTAAPPSTKRNRTPRSDQRRGTPPPAPKQPPQLSPQPIEK